MIDVNQLRSLTSDLTVLYVEDEPDIRKRMLGILGKFFQHIEVANNGKEGLDRYKEYHPDLIISDIQMPVMDGLKMAEEIHKLNREQMIVIVSAYNEIKYFSQAIKVGVGGFILKPVELDQLFDVLLKISTQAQQQKENVRYKKHMEELVHQKTLELARKLVTDDLTGLYNRIKLYEKLNKNESLVLMMVNLDNFGHVNTTYGFEIGNISLKSVADYLWNQKSPNSAIYRLTSDEFVFLFEGLKLDEAGEYAKWLHEKLYNYTIELQKGINVQITATMALVEGQGEELLHKGQVAIIEARQIGKNRVFICRGEPLAVQRQKNNIYWMNRVKKVLENETIVPFFQPIFNNKTKRIEKYECLARIVEDNEIITPNKFIEPAKLVGLISQISRVMIKKCFDYFCDKEFEFSINITDTDFKEGFLIDYLKKMLKTTKIKPQKVVFEVLEGISLTESTRVLEQLNALRDLGFKIAIDDFGAEQSNFSRLLDLKADFVKIDSKFIKNIHKDINSYKIAKAICFLAKNFDTQVIAEYVHCDEVQEKVIELEIDFSQGYLIGAPAMHTLQS